MIFLICIVTIQFTLCEIRTMSSKAERERIKQIQDKCQRLLNEMLKDDDNKYCVDCDAKGNV